jgi:hypothetical protein
MTSRIPRVLDASDPRILAEQRRPMASTKTKAATDKQLGLITRLAPERGFDLSSIDLASLTGGRDGTASALITALFGMSNVSGQGTTKVDPDAGLYRVNEDLVRVKVSKSGNWYAELAVKVPGRKSLKWDYLGRRIDLGGGVKLSEAEAGQFVGYCVMCGALLEDPDSIARGIGPVCVKKLEV